VAVVPSAVESPPVLSQVLGPAVDLPDGAAAAVLAFSLDLARSSPRPAWNLRRGAIPAAVIAVTSGGSRLGRYLIGVFGQPSLRVGQVLAWREPAVMRAARDVSAAGRS